MENCEHQNLFTRADFGRYSVREGGPIVSNTIEFHLHCVDCNEPFSFATDMLLSDDRLSVKLSVYPGARHFERDETYVPGQFQCPVCLFSLTSNFLSASTGNVAPNTAEPEPCPNGCGPLRRLTWRELGESSLRQLAQVSRRLFALERAWPEGYVMPDSDI